MSSLRSTSPSRTKPSKSLTVQPSDEDSTSFVKVYLRIRPLNDREETDKSVIPWQFNKTQIRSTHGVLRTTTFDRILPPEVSQKETYDEIVKPGTTYVQSVEYLQLMKDAKVVLEAFYNASLSASNLANTHIKLAREKGESVENYTKVVNGHSFNLQELASDYNV